MEGKTTIGNYQWRPEGTKRREADMAEKKADILITLRAIVDEEREKDPTFNISQKFLEELLKTYPELFHGVKNYGSLMRPYFSNDLDFLREKLGLPKKKKDNDY